MTGVPVSSCTRINPCETASQMYSKCIVEPLMRHPIVMTASNGRDEAAEALPSLLVLVGDEVSFDESIKESRLAELASMLGAALDACVLPPSMSFCVANGSSYDPGTVLTTMFSGLTPCAWSLAMVPLTREEMMASFHRAWTMAMRKPEPSYETGGGGRPLTVGSDMV